MNSGNDASASVGAEDLKVEFTPSGSSATCEATHSLTIVKVALTNIKFNHDTASSASDAINIRQDYNTPIDISNGEWVKGGANHPAAYTARNAVTIKARFTVEPDFITSADIWAVSTDTDGSLGDVDKTAITFAGGISEGDVDGYVELPISGNTPNVVKKTTTDTWQWKAEKIDGGSLVCDFDISGPHTVYTILSEPMSPWVNTFDNRRNAWVTALDLAIVDALCNGVGTGANALSRLAVYMHTNHNMTYDSAGGGRSGYGILNMTGVGNFNLTGYMTGGGTVNCYDQAAGLLLLSRLLGVGSEYVYMQPFGYILQTDLIGIGPCNNPFFPLLSPPNNIPLLNGGVTDKVDPNRTAFGNHAFVRFLDVIYDACAGPHLGTMSLTQYAGASIDISHLDERPGSADANEDGVLTEAEVNAASDVGDIVSFH